MGGLGIIFGICIVTFGVLAWTLKCAKSYMDQRDEMMKTWED